MMPKPWEQYQTQQQEQKKPWEIYQTPQPVSPSIEQSTEDVSIADQALGGLEAAATIGSSLIAEPIAGLAGIGAALNPFAEEGAAARAVEATREALTYEPTLPGAKAALGKLGETIKPAVEAFEDFEGTLGEYVLEKTGSPELAAIAHTLPSATLELLGAGTARRAVLRGSQKPSVKQAQKSALSKIEEAEQATGVRQLTSDVLPPETRAGKFMQQQGELISGSQRAMQQAERVQAVDNLLANYDVSDAARFEQGIVDGVKRSVDAKKAALADLYEVSTKQLDGMGVTPINKTKSFAESVIAKEGKKGSLADKSLIGEMQNYINSPDNLTFETVKSIRSAVGAKLKQARQGAPVQGSSDTAMLSQLYARLSNDMKDFADKVNPDLAARWKEADKEFSGFATGANKTGVKRLIRDGEATPEVVDNLLFSPKRSDIEFLGKNLDESGKLAAKQRVLQRMLEKSSPDGVEINPNRFQTQMNKMRKQVDTFFTGPELEAMDSLKVALNETRRAQDAAVTTATGQQVVPLFAMTNPLVLIPGVAQMMIERPAVRNLLIRRKAAKTAQARFSIDQQLQTLINQAGLTGAATTGAATGALTEGQ